MAGDPIKNKATKEEYQRIVKQEFDSMLQETYGDDVLEEGFWDKLKGGSKKVGKAYLNVFNAYGEVMQDVMGISPDDPKAPDVPSPDEMVQDLAKGDTEEAADAVGDLDTVLQQLADKADEMETDDKEQAEIEKKVQDLLKQADKIEGALEGEGADGSTKKTEDSAPLLDILDVVIDEWDAIQNKTKDNSLKTAMDYIEKVALAEIRRQKGLKKLKQIREKRKNG